MSYPVAFTADYVERRSRLSVFFRLLLLIPLLIVAAVYGLLATVVIVLAWFAIVVSGDYPGGMYDFVAGYTRFVARVTGFGSLICDPYPPFWGTDDPGYPVRVEFQGPLDPYSRLKTLFRIVLMIPLVILRWVIAVLLELFSIAAWFVIVISGRLPRGMFDVMSMATSYIVRSDAYIFLLTETYPPLEGGVTGPAPGRDAEALPAPEVPEAEPAASDAARPAAAEPAPAEPAQGGRASDSPSVPEPPPPPADAGSGSPRPGDG